MLRTGMISEKVGMTRLLLDNGAHVPVTVLNVGSCKVISARRYEKDGYNALQLGLGQVKLHRLNRASKGHFDKNHVSPARVLAEFRVDPAAMLDPGVEIGANHFLVDQLVDVTSVSIGKGFAGVMKRHGFRGLRASHGTSVSHRSLGSTGGCQDPGRVWKGKKMAGHMGSGRVTIHNLRVVSTDPERGLILIKGSVPGARGSTVLLRDAVRSPRPQSVPLPAGLLSLSKAEEGHA